MKLSEDDVKLFYKLRDGLYYYVNKKYPVIRNLEKPNLDGQIIGEILEIEEKTFSHPVLIDCFIEQNPLSFSKEEKEIIKNWRKKFVKSQFFIFSVGNDMIFLNSEKDTKAYEVLGLQDEIKEIIPFEPYMTNGILLPFKGKITYTGFLQGYNMTMGGGFKKSLTEDFFKAKMKYGLISSLDNPIIKKEESPEELIRFYLKDERNRYWHQEDINNLLKKYPSLIDFYYKEIGKVNSRKIKKKLSNIGINLNWFAVFNDVVIASGKNEKEVLERVKEILPENKIKGVYIFKYQPKEE